MESHASSGSQRRSTRDRSGHGLDGYRQAQWGEKEGYIAYCCFACGQACSRRGRLVNRRAPRVLKSVRIVGGALSQLVYFVHSPMRPPKTGGVSCHTGKGEKVARWGYDSHGAHPDAAANASCSKHMTGPHDPDRNDPARTPCARGAPGVSRAATGWRLSARCARAYPHRARCHVGSR